MSERIYNPNILLDVLIVKMQLKNDVALARVLGVSAPNISHFRHGYKPIGAAMLIRMSDLSGLGVAVLRELMGDRRAKYRLAEIAWTDEERAEKLGRSTVVAELASTEKEAA